MQSTTSGDRHRDPAEVPVAPVALVLGAGVDGEGGLSSALARRIDAAVTLYRYGKVRALLMSGDNSRSGYDEPSAMREAAVRAGVPPTAIVLDYAGFDTFSSCYRARHVFGLNRITVVSQDFHLGRAIWLCRRLEVEAEGFVAADDPADAAATSAWKRREVPACSLAAADIVRRRTPAFSGPREHTLDAVSAGG